jgi:drug/metabolite transporter (DMT)-like permease
MGEPVLASLLAWALLAERPPWAAVAAAPLILAGAVLALRERTPVRPLPPPRLPPLPPQLAD